MRNKIEPLEGVSSHKFKEPGARDDRQITEIGGKAVKEIGGDVRNNFRYD